MEKIYFKFGNQIYSIIKKDVAEHRASNYEDKDTKDWHDEVNFALEDESELFDWLYNNTDPSDFEFTFEQDLPSKGNVREQAWDELEQLDNFNPIKR